MLRQAAEILQAQHANPFRVTAYRKAAETAERRSESLRQLLAENGRAGLEAFPGIGAGISSAIAEMLRTGRWTQLERLRGSVDPGALFQTVPGIGPELAQRIHDALDVDTLEALEAACNDGRLDGVTGAGMRRAAAIRAALAEILGRPRLRRTGSIAYRRMNRRSGCCSTLIASTGKSRAGNPADHRSRRFNPEGKSWLPVLHMRRAAWHFTVLSPTLLSAHQLQRTRDWVVVYFYDDQHAEGQRTVVTEQRGPLAGRRAVRGRECRVPAILRARRGPPTDNERSPALSFA